MTIWIIEETVFGKDADNLERATKSVGAACHWLSMDQEASGRYGLWDEGDSVVFRGSFEAAESFRAKRLDASPGVIGDQAGLNCATYYPLFGERLLNSEYEFVPVGELKAHWADLQEKYGTTNLFVRPDTGAKAFSGQLVTDLELFQSRERPYLNAMAATDLCLVAPPKNVAAEYRLVVVDSRVVAGSRYKLAGAKFLDENVPDSVLEFGRAMAERVKLGETTYMLDIAEEEGGHLSVIEVNSFSCSDFYEADLVAVVQAVELMVAQKIR